MSILQARFRAGAAARALPFLLAAVAAQLPLAASAHGPSRAHVHGKASLDVAVAPQRVTLQLSIPLESLLGFERAPRSDDERARADAAVTRLRDAAVIFRIDPSAQCRAVSVELASAALKLGAPESDDAASGHADLDATYEFACADAGKATFVDVALFEFKRLHRVEVQGVDATGQFKRTLTPKDTRLVVGR